MKSALALVVGSMLLASPVLACSGNKSADNGSPKETKTADKGAAKKDSKTTT